MYPNLGVLKYSVEESSLPAAYQAPSTTGPKWTNLQRAARKIPQILLGFNYKKVS
jgi:hypothetical protein